MACHGGEQEYERGKAEGQSEEEKEGRRRQSSRRQHGRGNVNKLTRTLKEGG